MTSLVCINCPSNQYGGNESELVNHLGKPDAGELHVRFDEGDGSTRSRPYSTILRVATNLNQKRNRAPGSGCVDSDVVPNNANQP